MLKYNYATDVRVASKLCFKTLKGGQNMKSVLETYKEEGTPICLELNNGTRMFCTISDIRDDVIIVTHVDEDDSLYSFDSLAISLSSIAFVGEARH